MDGKDIRQILGSSLKEIRIAKGYTQEQLAEIINKQTNSINRIETGINFVTSDTLARLSVALRIHPKLLFSANPNLELTSRSESIRSITQLLQTFSDDKLLEVYNILRVMNK